MATPQTANLPRRTRQRAGLPAEAAVLPARNRPSKMYRALWPGAEAGSGCPAGLEVVLGFMPVRCGQRSNLWALVDTRQAETVAVSCCSARAMGLDFRRLLNR